MKLVQLLAKELKEWPEGAKYARQDFDGEICFVGGGIWSDFYASCVASDIYLEDGIGASQITEDQWKAEREKMNKPKWIRHRGGKCPVDDGTNMEYRLRDGSTINGCHPQFANWGHYGVDADIMAYRVIEETKDQEIEEVKKTNFGTLPYKLEVDTSSAMIALNVLSTKWDQLESPLKWRDEIIEIEAYEEEFRREREKLIRKLESEGFKMIDHAPAKCLLDELEAMDYESFCVGDTVVCINEKSDDTIAELTIGKEYRLILDDEELCVIDDAGDAMRKCIEIGCFKLVKRA